MPFSLSLSPFGVIVVAITAVAAVVTIVAVILEAPATVTLAAFVVALAVITTTFLDADVGLIIDCCVPSPPEEDHCLPPTSRKVLSWPLPSLSS